MACPWVADGGDDFQMWMAGVNILNKESWTVKNRWFSIRGWELIIKSQLCTKCYTGPHMNPLEQSRKQKMYTGFELGMSRVSTGTGNSEETT
jgi:hypothetical protein